MAISCIYKIQNKINGKVYIGSAINGQSRSSTHFNLLRKNKHHSYKLQRSFNKYKEDNFEFEIIEIVYFSKEMTTRYKRQILECIEQTYIDSHDAATKGYNVSKKAGNCGHGGREASLKGIQTRLNRGDSLKWTEEQKQKLSYILKNSKAFKEGRKRRNEVFVKKVYQYSLTGELINTWKSARKASEALDIPVCSIWSNCKNSCLSINNYIFSYEKVFPNIKFDNKKDSKSGRFIKKGKIQKYDLNNNFIEEYDSLKEFSIKNNYAYESARQYANGGKTHKGYKLVYA